MAHGLVSQLGGALTIESVADEGTTVSLWLPLSGGLATVPGTIAMTEPMVAGVAVLVDDEDIVRASTAEMLVEIGFEVIEARSGAEALAALRQAPHVDILVTDHLMPEMTGVELARTVLAERPGLPVLVVSGYSDAIGIEAGFPRLEKPFRHADLAAKLARLLSASSPDPNHTAHPVRSAVSG
jgi:CheY-like chemotaxis protein